MAISLFRIVLNCLLCMSYGRKKGYSEFRTFAVYKMSSS